MATLLISLLFLAGEKGDEAAVAHLPQAFADGLAAHDAGKALEPYWDSPQLVSIWPEKGRETTGIEAQRKKILEDLAATREIRVTIRNVHVTVAGDVGWGEARWDEHILTPNGKAIDFTDGRYT